MSSQRKKRFLFGIILLLLLPMVGCPSKQIVRKEQVKVSYSRHPVVRILYKRGKIIRYNIYNTSKRSFKGVTIVLAGIDCDGNRSRRIWLKTSSPTLGIGYKRKFQTRLSYFCRRIEVNAYDKVFFLQRLRRHRPLTHFHYYPEDRRVSYKIYNKSILPFRGLAIAIKGNDCMGPKPKKFWIVQSKAWLYPGYTRTFNKRLPYNCGDIRVVAFDLISFRIKLRKALRRRRLQQRQHRRQQHYNNIPRDGEI